MWRETVLPEINSLPGAKRTLAFGHRYIQLRLRENASHMRRHVIRAFRGMRKHRVPIGYLAIHESFQVAHDSRIGVFANYQRRARVADEYMT